MAFKERLRIESLMAFKERLRIEKRKFNGVQGKIKNTLNGLDTFYRDYKRFFLLYLDS